MGDDLSLRRENGVLIAAALGFSGLSVARNWVLVCLVWLSGYA